MYEIQWHMEGGGGEGESVISLKLPTAESDNIFFPPKLQYFPHALKISGTFSVYLKFMSNILVH